MPPNILGVEVQSEIIGELTEKNVYIVITDHDIKDVNTKLTQYIEKYYNNIKTSGAFRIWQRKQEIKSYSLKS